MRRSRSTLNIVLLLAAALFMRAVTPAGYMPERGADGGISIALCNSEDVLRIPMKDAGDDGGQEHRSASPCIFADLASPAAPPPDAPQIVQYAAATFVFALPLQLVEVGANPRMLPPARAPPQPV